MESHFIRHSTRCSKRSLNIDELSSSCSSSKQSRLEKKSSLIIQTKLTDSDFYELRQALKTISHYLQFDFVYNEKQRLTSPYYENKANHDNNLLLPLCTNEYFIRNGLLNHNDGPEIYDHILRSDLQSFSSPLTLLSNQKHLLTALTSNFRMNEYEDNPNETKSMLLRRNKVQTWERDLSLQKPFSMIFEKSYQSDKSNYFPSSLRTCSKKYGDNMLFPMMKVLGRK